MLANIHEALETSYLKGIVYLCFMFSVTYIFLSCLTCMQVLVEVKLSARILTLNRPRQLNALSFQMVSLFGYFWCVFLHYPLYSYGIKCLISTLKHLLYLMLFKLKYIYIYISLLFSFVLSYCVYALFAASSNTLYERI